MAKTNMIARDVKRKKLSQGAYKKREEIKAKIKSPATDEEARQALIVELNKAPRDESKIRVRNRCRFCGRARAINKKFGLCRIHLREAFVRGDVPGLRKSSW